MMHTPRCPQRLARPVDVATIPRAVVFTHGTHVRYQSCLLCGWGAIETMSIQRLRKASQMTTYIITDDDGLPEGVVNMNEIVSAGTKLAFDLAASCDDRDKTQQIGAELLLRVGPDSYGYACANALQVLATEILSPTLNVCAAAGSDLRPGIAAVAAGRDPSEAEMPTHPAPPAATGKQPVTNVMPLPRRLPKYQTPYERETTEPWTEEENPEFPSPDGHPADRLILARTSVKMLHGTSDSYDDVPVAAVFWQGMGESIEIGPWSIGLQDALALAQTLRNIVDKAQSEIRAGEKRYADNHPGEDQPA